MAMAMAVLLFVLLAVCALEAGAVGGMEVGVAHPGRKFVTGIRQVVGGEEGVVMKPDYVCQMCMELAEEAQAVLSDPDFEQAATQYVEVHACEGMYQPSLRKKCEEMVEHYMPELFSAVRNYAEPQSLCVSSGFCGDRGKGLMDVEKADPKVCDVCQDLARDALQFLEDNRTSTDIMDALHVACSKVPEVKKQCDLLVDVYGPELVRRISSTTPERFCQQTRLCSSVFVSKDSKDCQICQFVVLELKLKLRDPATQDKVLDLLIKSCSRVPNHVEECKLLVQQYVPFILANLDTVLDGNAICAKMGACP